jgi:acetyl esterase/lipase
VKSLKVLYPLLAILIGNSLFGAQPDAVIPYKKIGAVTLNLNIFFPPEHQAEDERPVIVFFFAGGWVGGNAKQFYRQSEYLASRGMVAISADYRIKSIHGTTPRECVMDAKTAIRFVRSQATKLGIDPNKIVAAGGSAGGHIAAATAMLEDYNSADEGSVSCIPNALVLYNPVCDNGPSGFGHSRVKAYWEDFSVLHNIKAGAPPTIVFYGDQDKYIPVRSAEAFKDAMDAAGNRCDYTMYAGEAHGFFNNTKYKESLRATDKFLESLGFLEGQPTL